MKKTRRFIRRAITSVVHPLGDLVASPVLEGLYNPRVEGIDNLPGEGPYVVMPKHQSMADPPLVWYALRQASHHVSPTFFMTPKLFGTKVIPRALFLTGAEVIYRGRKVIKSLEVFEDELEEGGCPVVFPEGWLFPGYMGKMKKGFFKRARRYEEGFGEVVDFLPMGIEYVFTNGGIVRTNVRFGEVLQRGHDEDLEKFMERTSSAIERLSGLSK
ncbi:MAG: lysophospholipid acyltransferase family protein [archaeon]